MYNQRDTVTWLVTKPADGFGFLYFPGWTQDYFRQRSNGFNVGARAWVALYYFSQIDNSIVVPLGVQRISGASLVVRIARKSVDYARKGTSNKSPWPYPAKIKRQKGYRKETTTFHSMLHCFTFFHKKVRWNFADDFLYHDAWILRKNKQLE